MSAHNFAAAVVLASALLAFWLGARFPDVGPSRLGSAVLHVLGGLAAIRAIPGLTDAAIGFSAVAAGIVVPFGIALPLLTYTFLSGLWALRTIHRSLSGLQR
jgi:hypothetical protein